MRKHKIQFIIFAMVFVMLAGCSNSLPKEKQEFNPAEQIVTMNRENGSGTKISFLNFLNVKESQLQYANENIASDTAVMLSAIESNQYAIGYLSHNELSPQVKAISIGNAMPTKENIASEAYPLTRTFYLVTKNDVSDLTQDFVNFIAASKDTVDLYGYIPIENAQNYSSNKPQGEIKISGSSSVYPLMENLIEQYKTVNPSAEIEISKTDSSNGIKNVENEIAHIAMSSRELTSDERKTTKQVAIAKDGVAIIVNANNPTSDLSLEQLKNMYIGKVDTWKDIL